MQKPIVLPTTQEYTVWYNNSYYIDKTGEILKIKGAIEKGSAIFFSRPRRWGKSLFLSTIKHFFGKDYYKAEYFEGKEIEKDEKLSKRAGKSIIISLDLKPLYSRETNSIDFDKIYRQILEQLDENIFENIFGERKPFLFNGYSKHLENLKQNYSKVGEFIKALVERLSKAEEVFLLIDEYDKPINDCLKEQKNEPNCQEILNELKSNLFSFLKDIPCVTLITGVNKLSMASFFSDFNNLKDFSYLTTLGFTEDEVKSQFDRAEIVYDDDIKRWYNGYNGSEFNPWAIMTYLERQEKMPFWSKTGTAPDYFRYLMRDILKVKNLDEFLELLKDEEYNDEVINLDYITEKNKNIILHYFYYAGLLTYTEDKKFAIPNNDVLSSYKNLLFIETETSLYYGLRNKSSEALLKLKRDTKTLKDFIEFLLKEKYLNHDKKDLAKIGEQIITSDVSLLYRTFARLDLRREVNILEGRTDLEYIDQYNEKVLYEFKVARKSSEVESKKKEALEQIKRYNKLTKYNSSYLILVNLEKLEVEVITY